MKILHLYKDYFPVLGGIENHVRMLAEAQAAQGHEVTVLVTSLTPAADTETRGGVRVIFASRWFNLSSAPFSLELFQQVARQRPDIAHLHSPYAFTELAQVYFGHARATVLTHHSDIVRQRFLGALYKPFHQRVLAKVNTIIATSPNYIASSNILPRWRDKCQVVPLGIPTTQSPIATRSVAPILQSQISNRPLTPSLPHSLTPSLPHTISNLQSPISNLLFVGRLRYYKGLNYLLEALPQLPGAHLTIVGTGPKEREWKALAESLNLDERVTWLADVPDAELTELYRGCDIFVLPCSERSEAFGTVQLEAMVASKPVVSCDVQTGVAWVNQDKVTGLVVPPKDPAALAAALGRLLADGALRARMGTAGQARVLEEFTLEKMVARVEAVYERALIRDYSPEGKVK